MDKLKEDLRKMLECPVCFEIMLAPITMCINGHNICKTCKPSLKECPTCRGEFVNIRNKTAEDLSCRIEHPCKYKKSGCMGNFSLVDKEKHELECRYRPHKCPFQILNKCKLEVPFTDMKKHLQSTHNSPNYSTNVKKGVFQYHLNNYKKSASWCQTVFTLDKVFFYHSRRIGNFLYMCYMYVGFKEDNNYKYTITIKSRDGEQSASISLKCPDYLDFISKEFPKEKCAVFSNDFINQCTNVEGKLPHEFEISAIIVNKFN